MTQKRIAREPPPQHSLERLDFIDPFSGEAAFTKEVLINIRDGSCVDVESGISRTETRQARPAGGPHANFHPGLKDAITLYDRVGLRIDYGLVQRVSKGAD
jgi:hypothetical protein